MPALHFLQVYWWKSGHDRTVPPAGRVRTILPEGCRFSRIQISDSRWLLNQTLLSICFGNVSVCVLTSMLRTVLNPAFTNEWMRKSGWVLLDVLVQRANFIRFMISRSDQSAIEYPVFLRSGLAHELLTIGSYGLAEKKLITEFFKLIHSGDGEDD